MASIRIPSENRILQDSDDIRSFLLPFGIHYDRWAVEGRIDRDATAEEILVAYEPEVTALKQQGGYLTADVVDVKPETPNLDALLAKFNKEHRHAEDEVRFIVKGRGLFYIHPENDEPLFSIEIEEGDFINVPAGTKHWFDLCADRTIRAIRLFKDMSGWTPLYTNDEIASGYQPLCFGPNPLAAKGIRIDQPVLIA